MDYEADLSEELDRITETGDTVIYLNYSGLTELPRELLENPAYQHIRRVYTKQNVLKSLVSVHVSLHVLLFSVYICTDIYLYKANLLNTGFFKMSQK
jgi:hypothetical protein